MPDARLIETPWGELVPDDHPRLVIMMFCWVHYHMGHHYYVTESAAACECGESCSA